MFFFFFFNDTATTEIYTLSLHDALPISLLLAMLGGVIRAEEPPARYFQQALESRSEEHTSELQSQSNLVCRLLLEKKKKGPRRVLASSQLGGCSLTSDARRYHLCTC